MITMNCDKCGVLFESHAANKRKFCSVKCYAKSRVTHGDTDSPLYSVYVQMIHRCHTESCKSYRYYGARGITVCEAWRSSYNATGMNLIGETTTEGISRTFCI